MAHIIGAWVYLNSSCEFRANPNQFTIPQIAIYILHSRPMSRSFTFGIVGGYGATGRMVVSELRKSAEGEILVGGRDLAQAKALAAEFDGRVSGARLDVLDANSLDDFCSRCSIIVNCGGPVTQLQDRVAQAAFRRHCHYVDPAGLTVVKERMLPHHQEITESGLSFVVSAGWLPGLTEIVPVYALAQARTKMEEIESLTVYYGDSGDWSTNALRDAVWYIHNLGINKPFYFHRGERVSVRMSAASYKKDLGGRIGKALLSMYPLPEQIEIGQRLQDCDFFAYSYLAGRQLVLAGALIALLPLPEKLGVRLLRNAFRKNRLPVGGFVVVQVRGRTQGHRMVSATQVIYDKHKDYWMNGLMLATVARMVSDGRGIQTGVHFLADAVGATALIAELRKAGVELTESFEPCE